MKLHPWTTGNRRTRRKIKQLTDGKCESCGIAKCRAYRHKNGWDYVVLCRPCFTRKKAAEAAENPAEVHQGETGDLRYECVGPKTRVLGAIETYMKRTGKIVAPSANPV